jgi:hypothetical protein
VGRTATGCKLRAIDTSAQRQGSTKGERDLATSRAIQALQGITRMREIIKQPKVVSERRGKEE